MITCTRCGICCTQLNCNPLYAELDRGDGTCRHLDLTEKTCTIFPTRPEVCNSEILYQKHFRHMPPEDFIAANLELCKEMQLAQVHKTNLFFSTKQHT